MATREQSATAQRILFPIEGDESALALYLRGDVTRARWTRSTVTLEPRARVSFASYFCAFPAGYWRTHTSVDRVTFLGNFAGTGNVTVRTVDGTGMQRTVLSVAADGRVSVDVPLADVSWVWFEVESGAGEFTILDARWEVAEAPMSTATVCITTYNRRDDCVRVLDRLADDPAILNVVDRIIVVDQGDEAVRQASGFVAAATRLGERLVVIEQANLGGSGGFSRGMIEALHGPSTSVLLLDDDVILEPESIWRMLAFQSRAHGDLIVGAHMLSAVDRTVLHSWGERVVPRGFWWASVDPAFSQRDLAEVSVQEMRDVARVDFNGWWMCLVPTAAIRRIGTSLPFFIKWDDAELGLRAAEAGIPTVSLPGAALWHMPWTNKDDGLDWQAYHQLRNRIVTALLHSRSRRGGGVLGASFAQDINHVLCLQYGSAAARRTALRDILQGPGHLPATIGSRVPQIRSLMAKAGQVVVADEALPQAATSGDPSPPAGALASATRLAQAILHQLRRNGPVDPASVDRALPREQGKWWALGLVDSATVASATGRGAFVARRDRATALALVRDAALLRLRLWLAWPSLASAYRRSLPDLVSPAGWKRIYASAEPGDARRPG